MSHTAELVIYWVTAPPLVVGVLAWHWHGYRPGGRYDRWQR